MKSSPSVSVLLLNWNGYAFTKACIVSLLKNNYRHFDIVIYDNGSNNDEAALLENEFKKSQYKAATAKHSVRVVHGKKNLGYASGMNSAFAYASGEYILVINNDMEFERNFIEELVNVLKTHKNVAICQPKLKHLGDDEMFDYSVAAGGYIDLFGYPFARGRIFTYVEKDHGQYDKLVKISWCGIFMAKKNVIKKTGFFDEIYINYGEDMDLCFRVYGAGYSIVNTPNAVGYHFSGGALKKNIYRKMYFHHRNNLIYIIKNFNTSWLILIIFIRIFLDWLAAFYYLLNKSPQSSLAVLHAHLALVGMLGKVLGRRQLTQKKISRKNIANMPVYKGSIIWDHFILGKKSFSELSFAKQVEI